MSAPDTAGVDRGASVDVRAAVQQQAGGTEEPVFSRDVEEGCAPKGAQAARRAAIQLGIPPVDDRRVRIGKGSEFLGAAKEDREDAGNVVSRVGSRRQDDLDACSKSLGSRG